VLRFLFCLILSSAALWAQEGVALVSQKAASSVAFYTWEGELLKTVPAGKHPHEIVLSADGRFAYTTDNGTMAIEVEGQGGNTVSIIDLAARKRSGVISLGEFYRPHGIDFHPESGRLLVSTENPDQLLIIDPEAKRVLRRFDTKGDTSHIVTLGADGRTAFVSNSRSSNVAAVNIETGEAVLIEAGERPEGSVLSKDGKRLYVVNRDSDEITVIDTGRLEKAGSIPTSEGPVRIGISADGRTLIYALIGAGQVGFADIAEGRETATVDLDGPPVSLEMSADGRYAFTCAQEIDVAYVISVAERRIVRSWKVAEGAGPDPMVQVLRQGSR